MFISAMSKKITPELKKKYPLLKEGYDILECPICDTECYPAVKYKNGTIRYNTHTCTNSIAPSIVKQKSFSILENGDLKKMYL